MPKDTISSLAEAIAKLEALSQSKAEHIKDHVEKDFDEIKKALESVQPYFNEIKDKVEKEAAATKEQLEVTLKENPLLALGAVGLVAFLIGLFIGRDRK